MTKTPIALALLATVAQYGALSLAAPTKAHAMEYSYELAGDKKDVVIVHAKGEIDFKEMDIFTAWLKTVPKDVAALPTFAVLFDSQGGNLVGADNLGQAIRKAGGRTVVDDARHVPRPASSLGLAAWRSTPR